MNSLAFGLQVSAWGIRRGKNIGHAEFSRPEQARQLTAITVIFA